MSAELLDRAAAAREVAIVTALALVQAGGDAEAALGILAGDRRGRAVTRERAKILVPPRVWRDRAGTFRVDGGVFDGPEGQGILEISSDAVSGAFICGWTAEELRALNERDREMGT